RVTLRSTLFPYTTLFRSRPRGSGSSLAALLPEVREHALLLEQRVDFIEEIVGLVGEVALGGGLRRLRRGVLGRVFLGQGLGVLARQVRSRLTAGRCHRDAPSSAH